MPVRYVKTEKELPKIGTQCPACGQGYIRASKFGGVWCTMCKTSWKISGSSQSGGMTGKQMFAVQWAELKKKVDYIYNWVQKQEKKIQ